MFDCFRLDISFRIHIKMGSQHLSNQIFKQAIAQTFSPGPGHLCLNRVGTLTSHILEGLVQHGRKLENPKIFKY